jgi:chromosome segregation ATPase
MTSDELERAIDFLLKSQAGHDARMQQIAEQGARTDERLSRLAEHVSQLSHETAETKQLLSSFADTQTNIMRVVTQTFDEQARINRSRRESDESLRAAMTELATRQGRTEATVDRLSLKVEALAEQTAGTDRRLEALIKIVEEARNGGR